MNEDDKKDKNDNQVNTGSIFDSVFNNQSKKESEKENVSQIIHEWLSPEHIDKKTRYTPNQVIAISILQSLAETYEIKTLQRFLTEFKTAKLSEGGKSSEELENILRSRLEVTDENELSRLSKYLE